MKRHIHIDKGFCCLTAECFFVVQEEDVRMLFRERERDLGELEED